MQLFISYAHADEPHRQKLGKHLSGLRRDGLLDDWHDRKIAAGTEWKGQIADHLNAADVILLLVSADFLASDYCWDVEMKRALERHDEKSARVIPVIVRDCDWKKTPFGKIQAIPANGCPVTRHRDRDRVWTEVAKCLRTIASESNCTPRDVALSSQSIADESSTRFATDAESMEVELIIERDYDQFSSREQESLLRAIGSLLRVGNLRVTKKRRNSVSLTIRLTQQQAEQLYWAVKRGHFARFGLNNAILHESHVSTRTSKVVNVVNGPNIIVSELIKAGTHFGHRASRWNPKMAPYIYARKGQIHIFDIRETVRGLLRAMKYLTQVTAGGSLVLFVGTKRQAQAAVEREALRCGMPFVTELWLGGALTNFRTLRSRLSRLEELESLRAGPELATYSRKRQTALAREYRKMYRNLNGLRRLDRLPECVVVFDPNKEKNVIREARALGITIVALIDTDCDPDQIDLPIPGNDDGLRSIEFIARKLADAVLLGRSQMAGPLGNPEQPERDVAGDATAETVDPMDGLEFESS